MFSDPAKEILLFPLSRLPLIEQEFRKLRKKTNFVQR
jgi:hypothetical protein